MIAEGLAGLSHPVADLQLLPGNPRRGDVDAVARSLERFGQRKPIVARRSDRVVVAGNHTLQAVQQLGWPDIAVVWVDDDDATAKAFALADNRTAELGGYDDEALAAMVAEVGAVDMELLGAAGYSEADLATLLGKVELPPAELNDPGEAPAPPVDPVTVDGDLWKLGPHRVLCGDSAGGSGITDVMGVDRAAVVFTDPPYGVDIQERDLAQAKVRGRRMDGKGVRNDNLKGDALTQFLTDALGAAYAHSAPGAAWYVCSPAGDLLGVFGNVLATLEGTWRHTLVWVKDQFVMGRADYHYRHEMIFYGWVPGAAHTWESDRTQDTVWEFARPRRSPEHPTMKPVELVERALNNSSKRGAIVLDPFGGSGTTLIAAHRTGRIARLVELDRAYVDVICRRYQEHTGIKPERVLEDGTTEPHDFTQG